MAKQKKNKKPISGDSLKVKDMDPRIIALMTNIADRSWNPSTEASVQHSDQKRFRIIQAFMEGEARSLTKDAKGNAELSTDGKSLSIFGEYICARKTDLTWKGKKVLLFSHRRWLYVDPMGGYKQKGTSDRIKGWTPRVAEIYGYVTFFVTAPLDFPEECDLTMDCYIQFRAEQAHALCRNLSYWSPNWVMHDEWEYWQGSYRATARRVLDAADLLGIERPTSEYSSLEEIDTAIPAKLQWVKTAETIRYWLAHDCQFTKEDEAYILTKPSKPVCSGYQIVGGSSMVVPKNPKLMWYWLIQPDRQLEDLMPFVRYEKGDRKIYSDQSDTENKIEELIRDRLQGKRINLDDYLG